MDEPLTRTKINREGRSRSRIERVFLIDVLFHRGNWFNFHSSFSEDEGTGWMSAVNPLKRELIWEIDDFDRWCGFFGYVLTDVLFHREWFDGFVFELLQKCAMIFDC